MAVKYNRDGLTKDITRIRGIVSDLTGREVRELLDAAGMMVMSFVLEDYVKKGRGGTGKDTVKWAPLARSTLMARMRKTPGYKRLKRRSSRRRKMAALLATPKVQIGVDTGRLINSLKPNRRSSRDSRISVRGMTVTVQTLLKYAKFFDAKREIMSDKTLRPAERQRDLDDLVAEKTQLIVERRSGIG